MNECKLLGTPIETSCNIKQEVDKPGVDHIM